MAPPPPSPARLRRRHLFLRQLLLLAVSRPAMSQVFPPPTPPPPDFSYTAFSPPSASGSGGGGSNFSLTTSLIFLGLVVALFFLGFFSGYLRRCAGAVTGTGRGGAVRGSVTPNTAVAAAAAAAFAAAANGGGRSRRRNGLDAAVMDALPVMTYSTARLIKAGKGTLECAVCLAEFADDSETLRLLPGCCHVFHAACIDVWLAAHVTCPVCRADLSDQAVAAAGHVLAADLVTPAVVPSAAGVPDHTVIDVETSDMPEVRHGEEEQHWTSDEAVEIAEERVDRYTLRLPERLRREIEEARRHRRVASAAVIPASTTSGRWASLLRTMSASRRSEADSSRRSGPLPRAPATAGSSRRWSALLRTLSWRTRSEADGSRRVAPVTGRTPEAPASNGQEENKQEVVAGDMATHMEKYYAHSLIFAGFVIDGDVAAGDWRPEVFQVSTTVQIGAAQL